MSKHVKALRRVAHKIECDSIGGYQRAADAIYKAARRMEWLEAIADAVGEAKRNPRDSKLVMSAFARHDDMEAMRKAGRKK